MKLEMILAILPLSLWFSGMLCDSFKFLRANASINSMGTLDALINRATTSMQFRLMFVSSMLSR